MAYIGKAPANSALTADDITDGIIGADKLATNSVTTVKVSDTNITSGKLADNAITLAKMASGTDGNLISYDASGNPVAVATGNDGQVLTSTGAGSPPVFETIPSGDVSNMVQLATTTLSGTATGWNGIFTSAYDSYMILFDQVGSTATGTQIKFKFYNETGATSDNTYRGRTEIYDSAGIERSQNWQNAYPQFTSNMDGNSTGTGLICRLYIDQPLNPTIQTKISWLGAYDRTDGNFAYTLGGGGTTDYATREHTGLYIFNEGGGSFTGRARVTLYGIKVTT
tara:strand:+ start:1093 stop:1938 length:846 start_codon:yes stop_codon:yes gene_type:complete